MQRFGVARPLLGCLSDAAATRTWAGARVRAQSRGSSNAKDVCGIAESVSSGSFSE